MVQGESFIDLVGILSDLGERHALIVIDTLNRNLGGSENDGDDMRAFTKAAELLQRTFARRSWSSTTPAGITPENAVTAVCGQFGHDDQCQEARRPTDRWH